jgi:hypothetical protein
MTVTEHLLACVAEEGGEITQDATKSLRFGLQDRNVLNPTGPTNAERLVIELNDMLAVVDMLVEEGLLPNNWVDFDRQEAKKAKVRTFMDYAVSVGTLDRKDNKV